MAVENILQGTDCTMATFQIKVSGVAIAISTINDYRISVYKKVNNTKTNLFTYQKTPVGTDKPIILVDSTTIGFVVDRVQTVSLLGKIYAELEVQLTADSAYISSFKNSGNDGYEIANIVQSANTTILP